MNWALPLSRIIAGIALAALFLFPHDSDAKVWENSYLKFNLPEGWDCFPENTAWVCRHTIRKSCLGSRSSTPDCKYQRKRTREAIIILAAKEKGNQDSFPAYIKHLKTPIPMTTKKGRKTQSRVIQVKEMVKINGHRWIDGQHLSSEIPGYYTRYLATIKREIAVLVTFSAHKLYYTKYSDAFDRAVQTLVVKSVRIQDVRKKVPTNDPIFGQKDPDFPPLPPEFVDSKNQQGRSKNYLLLIMGFIMALGAVIFFIRKKKK